MPPTIATVAVAALAVSASGGTADPPIHAELVGRWNDWPYAYADVWGDGQYAYLCHFGDAGVDVLDIGDPFHPALITEIRPDFPNQHASSQDVQVGDGLLFIALEADGADGVLIVDVRDPLQPVKKTLVTIPGFADVHNVFYDNRILYLANGRTSAVGIVDLTDYNPDNAPARITQALWILEGVGTSFIHDITVQNGRLYANAWNSGLWIYEVPNIRRRRPTLYASTTGMATHSCWPTDNGRFVVTGEERGGGGIKVFEVIPPSPTGTGRLILRNSLVLPGTFSVHNQLIDGHRLYDAWYQAGLVVHDVDPLTGALTLLTRYDTSKTDDAGYGGAWGVYPYLGEDKVLVSDIQTGLFVIDVSGNPKLHLAEGLPASVSPFLTTPVSLRVLHADRLLGADAVALHVSVSRAAWSDIPMQPFSDGTFVGDLPAVPCGSAIEFYFTAQTGDGQTLFEPAQAPMVAYSLASRTNQEAVFPDGFESDAGWTSGAPGDTATGGIWVRGNPIGTIAQPENDNPLGAGTLCWFTGQGAIRGDSNQNDVDGGTTTLLSPIFDASFPDAEIGYARWFGTNGNPAQGDALTVSISSDGGANWIPVETVSQSAAFWTRRSFLAADYVEPTSNMRLKFAVSDRGSDSLVEAAVDDFVLSRVSCEHRLGDRNGDGRVDLSDHVFLPGCLRGPSIPGEADCDPFDSDFDGDVDLADVRVLQEAHGR